MPKPDARTDAASRGEKRPVHTAVLSSVLAAVYFAAAKLGLALAVVHPSASAVWPPTGLALAAFLLFGGRVWPGIALGAFLANITTAGSIATSAGIAAGNTLEGLAGSWLLARFAGGRDSLMSAAGVFKFVLAAGVSTVVSATMGVTSLALAGFAPWSGYADIWTTWWLGDAMGALLIAPPLLLWGTGGPPRAPRHRLQAIGASTLILVTGAAYFHGIGVKNAPIAWFWVPSVVWVSYSFGQRAAATSVVVLAAVTVWCNMRGLGPFVLPSVNTSLLLLQAFLGAMSVLSLTLSAVVAARERAFQELARAHDELDRRVRARTEELSRANERLIQENRERLRLEQELLDSGERERLRLGWDLHDDLGQLLTGIGFLSSTIAKRLAAQARPEAASADEIRSLVQQAIAKTRTVSVGLTPVSLGTGGLFTAIQELVAMTERVFDVTCTLEYSDRIVVERPIAATNVYRIVQEAISNAVRHGKSRNIAISFSVVGDRLALAVRDDGIGMPESTASQRNGLGLGIMKYRAEMIGGTLDVLSDETGTTVACTVPGIARVERDEP